MSEALCQCGHGAGHHARYVGSCGMTVEGTGCELHVCTCLAFSPPPTREPIRLTDEAEAWAEWGRNSEWRSASGGYMGPRFLEDVFKAGFRAARRAGGPTLADAWDEGYTNGYRLAESYLTRPDGTHVLPTNPYRTPESEDTE